MAGNAFDNLNTIALSDNFRAWFDKTNEVVGALNPVAVYGVTPGTGITVAIDSNGIASVGLSLEDATTGDTMFTGSITFSNEVRFSGLTLDLHPSGGNGATVFGRVVRSVNGATGDVTLSFTGVNDQTSHTGDVLIKAAGTLSAYTIFQGFTFDSNRAFKVSTEGGLLLGGSAGITGLNQIGTRFRHGSLAIVGGPYGDSGVTSAFLSLLNLGYTGSDNAERGMHAYFGRIGNANTDNLGLVFQAGGTNGDNDTDGPLLVLDSTNRRIGVNGITSALGGIHIKTQSTVATSENDILIQNANGNTAAIRTALSGSTGEYVGLEGSTSITTPRLAGFQNRDRLRAIIDGGINNFGVELRHNSTPSTFTIQTQHSSGASLSPAFTVSQDGDIIVGGISAGITGSTFASVNLVSGRLLLGGTHGVTLCEGGGIQTIVSGRTGGGESCSFQVIFADSPDGGGSTTKVTNVEFSGIITEDMVHDLRQSGVNSLAAKDEFNADIFTPHSPAIDFFDFDSSGNKRYAVGHFEIEVTLPLFKYVSENNSRPLADNAKYPVAGILARLDSKAETTVAGEDPNVFLIGSPSKGTQLINIREMVDGKNDNTTQLKFTLTGNCETRCRLSVIASLTHALRGKREGGIYLAPGSYKAKFTNVE